MGGTGGVRGARGRVQAARIQPNWGAKNALKVPPKG